MSHGFASLDDILACAAQVRPGEDLNVVKDDQGTLHVLTVRTPSACRYPVVAQVRQGHVERSGA